MQCKVYDSRLALRPDLQDDSVLMVFSILVGVARIPVTLVSGKCTNLNKEQGKVKASIAAVVVLMISGLLCLITVLSPILDLCHYNN